MTRIERLIDEMSPEIREAFLAAVYDVRSEAQLAVIAGHLEAGRFDLALEALNIDPAFFAPLDDALTAAYLKGGRSALAGLPVIPDPVQPGKWLSALTLAIRARRGG